jgi:hypothetical protein
VVRAFLFSLEDQKIENEETSYFYPINISHPRVSVFKLANEQEQKPSECEEFESGRFHECFEFWNKRNE